MKKRLLSIVLALSIVLSLVGPVSTFASADVSSVNYKIVRDDRSIKDSSGKVLMDYYYDKVVLTSGANSSKINQLIEQDCKNFFKNIKEHKEFLLDVPPGYMSYMNTAEPTITKNDDGILSISIETALYLGGSIYMGYYGLNYDLNTGKRLSLTDIFSLSDKDLLNYIKNKTINYIRQNPYDGWHDDVEQRLERFALSDFAYFVDGNNVCICYPDYSLTGFEGTVFIECPIINNRISVVLNGKEIEFDQPPIMYKNRILVPIRAIAEAMGDDVYWNQEYGTAFIVHGKEALMIKMEDKKITVVENENWKQWKENSIDVPAMNLNSRILVPVRAFCESLGSEVEWDGATKTAYITYDFKKKKEKMDVETFSNINTVFYALNGTVDRFKSATEDVEETFDRRNHVIDNSAMGISNIWSGVQELLSGLSNAENLMKDNIGMMLVNIPGNETIIVDAELLKTLFDAEDAGYTIIKDGLGLNDAVLNAHPTMKMLDQSIEEVSNIRDAYLFSVEQLAVFLSNYQMNVQYLHTLRDTLEEQGLLNDALRTSLFALEKEYANKFWQVMGNARDELTKYTITEGVNLVTAGYFQVGEFTWDIIFKGTGATANGEALKTFYSLYCINGALDSTYKANYNKILSGNYTPNDVVELKRLDDMQRATKIQLYKAMEELYNKKEMKEYCKKEAEKLSVTSVVWKAE